MLSTALACAIHLRLSFITILIGHVSRREMLINRDFDQPSHVTNSLHLFSPACLPVHYLSHHTQHKTWIKDLLTFRNISVIKSLTWPSRTCRFELKYASERTCDRVRSTHLSRDNRWSATHHMEHRSSLATWGWFWISNDSLDARDARRQYTTRAEWMRHLSLGHSRMVHSITPILVLSLTARSTFFVR